jgi:RecA/RadA recombinase
MKNIIEEFVKRATITGHVKPVKRIVTGLWSFDRAFRSTKTDSLGFPLGKLVEIWGPTSTGKSTIVYSLAGMIAANEDYDISLADFEDFDPDFLSDILAQQGFFGEVHSVLDDTDEKILDELTNDLQDGKSNYGVGILDAVGAISPFGELSGDLGQANMGQRAKLMGQFSRRVLNVLRKSSDYKCVFMINHQQMPMGGFAAGYKPPGGDTKGYLASIRIPVSRLYIKTASKRLYGQHGYQVFPDGSYCVEGQLQKNKWGLHGANFYLFVLSGKGIHKGLTAVLDGFMLGLVDRDRRHNIKIGNDAFGTMKELIQKAQNGEDEVFQPFFDVLSTNVEIVENIEEEKEQEDD